MQQSCCTTTRVHCGTSSACHLHCASIPQAAELCGMSTEALVLHRSPDNIGRGGCASGQPGGGCVAVSASGAASMKFHPSLRVFWVKDNGLCIPLDQVALSALCMPHCLQALMPMLCPARHKALSQHTGKSSASLHLLSNPQKHCNTTTPGLPAAQQSAAIPNNAYWVPHHDHRWPAM